MYKTPSLIFISVSHRMEDFSNDIIYTSNQIIWKIDIVYILNQDIHWIIIYSIKIFLQTISYRDITHTFFKLHSLDTKLRYFFELCHQKLIYFQNSMILIWQKNTLKNSFFTYFIEILLILIHPIRILEESYNLSIWKINWKNCISFKTSWNYS